jgi:rRNA maturation endonuclease Nob1
MGLVSTVQRLVSRLRSTDPYHYRCTVCERSFGTEQSVCPDCGGDVERVAGGLASGRVDPGP